MMVPETAMLCTKVPATLGRLQSFAVVLGKSVNTNRTEAAFGSCRTFEEYASHITAERLGRRGMCSAPSRYFHHFAFKYTR